MATPRKKAGPKPRPAAPAPAGSSAEGLRRVYLAALGLTAAIAFASLAVQIDGLIGPHGIVPVHQTLPAHAAARGWTGAQKWLHLPTLMWILPWSWGPALLCAVGFFASLAVATGRYAAPALLVAYASYLSLCTVSSPFLDFQWDALLCEVLVASVLVAPWGGSPRHPAPASGWWLLRWILFRLVFFGGLVKLTSGDPTWRDLSALGFHFWTQPLPNPVSLWAAALPGWLGMIGVALTFVVELVLVFGIFAGRTGRRVAFGSTVALMVALAATGNYGFFQLLTVVLALSLLDDADLARVRLRVPAPPTATMTQPKVVAAWALAALPIAASLAWLPAWYGPRSFHSPAPVLDALRREAPFQVVNRYGLFATMTTSRPLPMLEAQWGDGDWVELTWRWQTSDPGARPAQAAPHMPRLDWQLWFAGLSTCDDNPWLVHLQDAVLRGDKPVDGLIGDMRLLTGAPPDAVRLTLVDVRPASNADPSRARWTRTVVGPYCPARTRADVVDAATETR
jgi:hypothetical protein